MPHKRLSKHDRFFRAQMSNPKVAREFFEANLPDFLKKDVDLSTLQLRQDSFIGDDLRQQVADLLFEVSIKGERGYFYALCEHQSTVQKMMPFRMLQYMIAIQKQHLEKHKTDVLPFVFPILVYAGKDNYTYSMDFFSLFGPHEDIARKVWNNPYPLIDLNKTPDEELEPYLYFGATALLMKHIRDRNALTFLSRLLDTLVKIEKRGESGYIVRSISYLIEAGNISDSDDFVRLVTEKLSLKEEDIMTLAEQWEKKGLQKGIEQGMQQGAFEEKKQIALGMLNKKMDVMTISEITGLTQDDIKNLKLKA